MATSSKILRRNFAMKFGSSTEVRAGLKHRQKQEMATSFARSTREMVKSYISGTYKTDSANSFWNELTHVNVAAPRAEHKGPLRTMLYPSQPAILPVASPCGPKSLSLDNKRADTVKLHHQTNGETGVPKTRQASAVAALTANRRLLKNSNGYYKIVSNRRFGSSASSSCGSIFKRHDDRQRVSSFKRTTNGGFIERLYNTQSMNEPKSSLANLSSSKYLLSLRNQKIPGALGSVAEALKVSTNIQQELMPIDQAVRERISIKNSAGIKVDKTDSNANSDPMSGWHHPPSPDKLQMPVRLRERLWYQREPSISAPLIMASPPAATKTDRAQAALRTAEYFSDRINSMKINESEDAPENKSHRLRVVRKPARLTLQCSAPPASATPLPTPLTSPLTTPLSTTTATVATEKPLMPNSGSCFATKRVTSSPQSTAPIATTCAGNSDDESESPKMSHMTARRIAAAEHTPVRRFSLRRPPKADVPHITSPTPGPAAESLNMQQQRSGHSLISIRNSPMSAFAENVAPNSSRYRQFNYRRY